jgi:glycosyltransferase involved in cell wall biosynthesis
MDRPLRILYAAGPGNVLGTFLHWRLGEDDPTQIAMTYSGQFYDVCRELGARAYVVASCRTPGEYVEGDFRILHRPVPFEGRSGLLYHVGQFYWGVRLLGSALRVGADVAVVCAGTHWFVLWLMTLFGIQVVPSLHCVLWNKYGWNPTFFQRVVQRLNGWFLAGGCASIISVSDEITAQVDELTGGSEAARRIRVFVPQYRRRSFANVRPVDGLPREPFRVLYVGRVERNKGVFDVLTIARRFAAEGRTEIEFDICGSGGALEELRAEIAAAGLSHTIRCHGHCGQDVMSEMYSRCHVVIVPTTTEFIEGFNKVVAEGVLAGRPVVTSSVCPALSLVRGAVFEVPPDDAGAYAEAILRLKDDQALYEAKRRACDGAREQFYDPKRGWAQALTDVLARVTSASPAPNLATTSIPIAAPTATAPAAARRGSRVRKQALTVSRSN